MKISNMYNKNIYTVNCPEGAPCLNRGFEGCYQCESAELLSIEPVQLEEEILDSDCPF